MGAWGKGLLDNDTALDVAADWERFVQPRIADSAWGGEDTWQFFRRTYFRHGINPHDTETNAELLALGALHDRHGIAPARELRGLLGRAANAELRQHALDEWDDPKARKRTLLEFLAAIGEPAAKATRGEADTEVAAEIARLKPFTDQLDRWAGVVSPPHDDDEFERLYPPFFDAIEKSLLAGLRPGAERTPAQARLVQLRFMLMAFHVAWKAELPPDGIRELVRQAQATEGHFFMALDIGGADA
jgi:hypothetical protein